MFDLKRFFVVSALLCLACSFSFADELEDNWNDFLHYTAIGRLDLASGYAQKILDSEPDPVRMLALADANPNGYRLLLRTQTHSEELGAVSGKILDLIEKGRFVKRIDADVIRGEIRKLSTTIRARAAAQQRLKNAGLYLLCSDINAAKKCHVRPFQFRKELPLTLRRSITQPLPLAKTDC